MQHDFKSFLLTETFKNLFKVNDKKKWVDEVWDVLQLSYAKIGGIKGKGFGSKEEMMAQIPFWKIAVKGGKIVAVIMYKDRGGRKSIALGTNATPEGKAQLLEMMKADLKRSFGEFSGPALKFVQRNVPEWEKYRIEVETVEKAIKKGIKKTGQYTYTRPLAGKAAEKVALGVTGKTIKAPK